MKRIVLSFFTILLVSAFSQAQNAAGGTDDADSKRTEAEAIYNKDDYEGALKLFLEANAAYEKEGKTNTAEYAKSLNNTALTYLGLNDKTRGTEYAKRALELREELFGRESEEYIGSLNNLALMTDDYEEAARIQEQVIELCAALPSEHKNYGMLAMNMGRYYLITERYADAAKYLEIALPTVEKFGPMYEKILSWLSHCYTETGDTDNLSRILVLVDEHNKHEIEMDCDEPGCMRERAEYYGVTGDNAKAKEYYITTLAMDMTDDEKLKTYESYAFFLHNNKEYSLCADYYMMAAGIVGRTADVREHYIRDIYLAALSYYLGKEYDKAIDCYNKILIYYSAPGILPDNEKIAQCHSGIGNALSAQKKYGGAKAEYLQVREYYEKNDPENIEYPKAIVHLANAEKFSKEYDAAIPLYKEAMAIYQERGLVAEYQDTADALNLCYSYSGREQETDNEAEETAKKARNKKLDDIIKQETDALDITKTYMGNLGYAESLGTIAGSYHLKEDYSNAVKYYNLYVPAVREAVRDEFRMRGESERMLLWSTQTENVSEILETLLELPDGNDSLFAELSALTYDALLLSKGILLNSSIAFEKVLSDAGDARLSEIYRQTRRNEEEITRLRTEAATEDDLEKALALARENQALQLELYKGCAEYADFTDYVSYTWRDVQKALDKDDVAVEFASIEPGFSDDENYMVAIVVTKNNAPAAIPICNLSIAKFMQTMDGLYTREEPGAVVWTMLSDFFEGKKRLFFSADGVFHNIGIEYLQFQGKPLSESLEVYRLSSTKELCRARKKAEMKNVALFGGIDYNNADTVSAGNSRAGDDTEENGESPFRGYAGAGLLQYLKNSLREVQDIEKICRENNIPNVSLYSASGATEAAFRALDNTDTDVLHIATHGKYEEKKGQGEAESMDGSVIAFAGANNGGDKTVKGDGIVSAADVAKMNLRKCDLAVLSACQTGLGRLGDDGVFGLQRGFKNAGAHTLLMTIKEVDDTAATELMINFYRYLMGGKTKREALSLAQREARAKGLSDANGWAAYILLDGID